MHSKLLFFFHLIICQIYLYYSNIANIEDKVIICFKVLFNIRNLYSILMQMSLFSLILLEAF